MKRILIRVDADEYIGMGHFMRSLALAQECKRVGYQPVFVMSKKCTQAELILEDEGMRIKYLNAGIGSVNDARKVVCLAEALSAGWIVLDGYCFGAEYQKTLKKAGLYLLCIDDYGHASNYYADIIVNQNLTASEKFYCKRKPYSKLLLGTRYVLLRSDFLSWKSHKRVIRTTANRLLVTMGGSDPRNSTTKVIKALLRLKTSMLKVKVVVGALNPNYDKLSRLAVNKIMPLEIIRDSRNMPQLMAWADIAISAAGSTCWELAFMKLPAVVIVTAGNQKKNAEKLGYEDVAINLGEEYKVAIGDISSSVEALMNSYSRRKKMLMKGRSLVGGDGAKKVVKEMLSLVIKTTLMV
ncbi:MAG: UDP-2,4-diacetamido-2,4,6-trideoxy-beta-L-altropyranose hydrolase [Candidatus Omnitrophica bacterium]|nr:UDP-2,4-diacetamido-2,4,6-trideoxy-beta-L-altropyranose hydrolase [Candidatus Omnitrophota bacterium]